MRFSTNGTLSGAMSTSAATKGLRAFNKCWTAGDSLRVFYPLVWVDETQAWDVIVGAVWGHEIRDTKKLKFKNFARFIPSLCEVNPDGTTNGEPDLAYKFSMIAPVFITAQKERELANVRAKKALDEATRMEAIKDIEARYDPSSMSSAKPVLGKRDFITTAICVCAKFSNNKLDPSTTSMVYQPIKGTKANSIIEILGDVRYLPIHHEGEDFAYLEVQYNFPANMERTQSSKDCKILGLTESERTAVIDPESWKVVEAKCKNLPKKPEDIVRRTTRNVSEQELRQAISSYAVRQLDDLDVLTPELNSSEIDTLCKNADVLKDLNLIRALSNEQLIQALNKATQDTDNAAAVIQEAAAPTPVPDAPTLDSILKGDSIPEPVPAPSPAPMLTPTPEPTPVEVPNVNSLQAASASASSMSDDDFESLDLEV